VFSRNRIDDSGLCGALVNDIISTMRDNEHEETDSLALGHVARS
jgi:hypothetical protein